MSKDQRNSSAARPPSGGVMPRRRIVYSMDDLLNLRPPAGVNVPPEVVAFNAMMASEAEEIAKQAPATIIWSSGACSPKYHKGGPRDDFGRGGGGSPILVS